MSVPSSNFDTSNVPYSVLQFMAQKTQESLMNGGTATVTGNQASKLAQMAGITLDAKGNATMGVYTPQQKALGNVLMETGKAAGPAMGQSFTSWLMSGAANFSLIAFGAIIAIAALIYSQKENIATVVKQGAKVAALAA